MKARVVFNNEALRSLYAELASNIELADQSLREKHSGLDVEAVIPEARRSLADVGLELSDTQLREYALSISERRDFEFVLE